MSKLSDSACMIIGTAIPLCWILTTTVAFWLGPWVLIGGLVGAFLIVGFARIMAGKDQHD